MYIFILRLYLIDRFLFYFICIHLLLILILRTIQNQTSIKESLVSSCISLTTHPDVSLPNRTSSESRFRPQSAEEGIPSAHEGYKDDEPRPYRGGRKR